MSRADATADGDEITLLAETFRLLGDPTRLRILIACLGGPMAVGAIAETVGASQTLVSHHLRLLRAARLVRGEKQARHVLYALTDAHVSQMLRDMIDHAREDDHEPAAPMPQPEGMTR